MFARIAKTPRLPEALRDFALGQDGPDALRGEAARVAQQEGFLTPNKDGNVRLWLGGEWRNILMVAFEIHDEPYESNFSRGMLVRLAEAIDHMDNQRIAEAEVIFQDALKEYPDDPSLLFNLAGVREAQGRRDETLRMMQEIFEKYPDYIFARATLARAAIQEGDFVRAEELLQAMWMRRRLHFSEMRAWLGAQIELFVAQMNYDAAESWLELWRAADPEAPHQMELEAHIRLKQGLSKGQHRKKS